MSASCGKWANAAPVITLLGTSPVTIIQGDTYADAGATASDAEDGDLTGSIVVGGLPIDTSVVGTYTVTYDVSDSRGKTALQVTRTVIVEAGNAAPVADAGSDINVETAVVVTLDGSASYDPDGDAITFTWRFVSVAAGSSLTTADISNADTPSPSFTPDVAGDYVLGLEVSDNDLMDEDFVTVTATAITANVPPNADAGSDQDVETATFVTLDGTGSNDPDNGPLPLTYQWSFISVPAGSGLDDSMIADATMAIAGFTPDVDGVYELMLEVSDGSGDAPATDTVTITASTNVPPVADAGADQVVTLGSTVVLDGSASRDPDFGPAALAFSWSFASLPTGSALNNADIADAATSAPSFVPDIAGTYLIRVDVSDGAASNFDQVLVVVGEPPAEPLNVIGRARLYHVNVVWDPSATAASYTVYRKLDGETGFMMLGTTDTTVFVDDMPTTALYADYYVEAVNEFGTSDPSAVVRVYPALRTR